MFCSIYSSFTHYFLDGNRNIREKSNYLDFRAGDYSFIFAVKTGIDYFTRGPPVLQFTGNAEKTGGKRMKEKQNDSVQNRFTAYLMASVGNTRKKYWEKKCRLQGMESVREDNLERNYTDFEEQYRTYIGEHTDFIFRDWQRYGELLNLLESGRLAKAISRLKDRERVLLFARIYGELTFAELGEQFRMEPKQAEMAYYYVLRKLRKELKGKDEL